MIIFKEKQFKKQIIETGKRLSSLQLAAGRSGNLSARIDARHVLVTQTKAALGSLKNSDILKVDLTSECDIKNKRLTTEFPLHNLIYKNFPYKTVIHCHPALVNAYFSIYPDIKALTFETKLYLGHIPVVMQDTPAVTSPELVIEALKLNNLVVLKNHGVVSVSDNFKDSLYLIETLEDAVRIAATARLFKKEILDTLDSQLKENLACGRTYDMFSKEHIQAIVDLVNKDEFIAKKGAELDLTLQLAVRLDGAGTCHKLTFQKGKITSLDPDDNAPFVISAPREVWEMVFLGKLEPFVATTQGKMKLKGEIGKLSRWYVPFSRLFELFKQVKIKT